MGTDTPNLRFSVPNYAQVRTESKKTGKSLEIQKYFCQVWEKSGRTNICKKSRFPGLDLQRKKLHLFLRELFVRALDPPIS